MRAGCVAHVHKYVPSNTRQFVDAATKHIRMRVWQRQMESVLLMMGLVVSL